MIGVINLFGSPKNYLDPRFNFSRPSFGKIAKLNNN
jgi:hypothetical protein